VETKFKIVTISEAEAGNHPLNKWVKSLKDKTTIARIYA